uniref:NAD(P)-dependent dehydrogenase, short-chain alcohol dehydrogenase family n=1 Tax=Candidatus Kentrum sp. TUN TaxID=2126343 RepID=A0A451A512_9GAMM|nr:MAG: NAD(P)-dependent dehydrogenase, short-chain alcohol dehydrogenase family [Candidatus Kentron sp. TUN]VFK61130.1 MAG: NAD(P)-dependent dehydrogenase, short-chain alcohol dehydrogenase family [Candidatus Kentron sp. TUN]
MKNVFITGISSGLGYALTAAYLDRNWQVFGVSRRTPENLAKHPHFRFCSLDLRQHSYTGPVLKGLLANVEKLDLAILNAGIASRFDDLSNVPLDDLKDVMDVNVWANKTVIDHLYADDRIVKQIVTMSSGASILGNRGWAGYSLSKATLNMLTKLYAQEYTDTHFCAFAPGVIETPMAEQLCKQLSDDQRFFAIEAFCAKRNTPAMLTPKQAAEKILHAIEQLPILVESGEFTDIRSLPGV